MASENLMRLHGTSSKEIENNTFAKAKAIYEPQIQALRAEINCLKQQLHDLGHTPN